MSIDKASVARAGLIMLMHAIALIWLFARTPPAPRPASSPRSVPIVLTLARQPEPAARTRPEAETRPRRTAAPHIAAQRSIALPVAAAAEPVIAILPSLPGAPAAASNAPSSPSQLPSPQPAGERPVDYASRLLARLAAFRRYPLAAKEQHRQGLVSISFVIDAQGNASDVRIVSSAGRQDFNDEALELPRRAAPLPAPPADLHPPVRIEMPIAFTLRE